MKAVEIKDPVYHDESGRYDVEVKSNFCTTIVKRTNEGVIVDVFDIEGVLIDTMCMFEDDFKKDPSWEKEKVGMVEYTIAELERDARDGNL